MFNTKKGAIISEFEQVMCNHDKCNSILFKIMHMWL